MLSLGGGSGLSGYALALLVWGLHVLCCHGGGASHHRHPGVEDGAYHPRPHSYAPSSSGGGQQNQEEDFSAWLAGKQRLPLKASDYDSVGAAYLDRGYRPLLGEGAAADSRLVQDLLPVLVNNLMREISRAEDLVSRQPQLDDDDDSLLGSPRGGPAIHVRRRKAFWQPLRGPLPVETRFANFGSRIEPEKGRLGESGGNSIKTMKAMRYG